MSKIVLNDVTNLNSLSVINDNFDKIELEFQNRVWYRNNINTEPNTLEDDIDFNNHDLYNVKTLEVLESFTVNGQNIEEIINSAETNVQQSALNAAASATAAANSATNAASSATSAANLFDQFDDRYLGSKASNPSVDNDGNPLLSGALYWNSGSSEMRVWNGSAWVAVQSTSAATAAAASATAAATSATNAQTSATTATTQASAAATQASQAASSASAAATSASNASASATAAATSASNAAATITTVQASATAAATSATNAATSATEAASSASSALASKNDAANSATSASNSAISASASVTNAQTFATNASNSSNSAFASATNASNSATAAAESATSAANSATSAAASFDAFDDRYLGSKTSDPSVDNDGNALLTGALYWNSTANEMRVYNGTAWLAAYLPPAGFVTQTGVETLTNKRITPRAVSTTTTTSPWAWNSDDADQFSFTALANALTISADAGTPTDGQRVILRFEDNGVSRALTWTTGTAKSFRVVGVTLPTATVVGKVTYVGCIYNTTDQRWDAVAVATEA